MQLAQTPNFNKPETLVNEKISTPEFEIYSHNFEEMLGEIKTRLEKGLPCTVVVPLCGFGNYYDLISNINQPNIIPDSSLQTLKYAHANTRNSETALNFSLPNWSYEKPPFFDANLKLIQEITDKEKDLIIYNQISFKSFFENYLSNLIKFANFKKSNLQNMLNFVDPKLQTELNSNSKYYFIDPYASNCLGSELSKKTGYTFTKKVNPNYNYSFLNKFVATAINSSNQSKDLKELAYKIIIQKWLYSILRNQPGFDDTTFQKISFQLIENKFEILLQKYKSNSTTDTLALDESKRHVISLYNFTTESLILG